jgi:hypothetical protein
VASGSTRPARWRVMGPQPAWAARDSPGALSVRSGRWMSLHRSGFWPRSCGGGPTLSKTPRRPASSRGSIASCSASRGAGPLPLPRPAAPPRAAPLRRFWKRRNQTRPPGPRLQERKRRSRDTLRPSGDRIRRARDRDLFPRGPKLHDRPFPEDRVLARGWQQRCRSPNVAPPRRA